MHEARLWKPLPDGRAQCRLCAHFCLIAPGERGICAVRENQDGVLRSLAYNRVPAFGLDPVEKKPLFHFLPGHKTFSFGTAGCNLSCSFCQNHDLSQTPRLTGNVDGQTVTPELLVLAAQDHGAASLAYTYSEPTVFFELMQDTARIAHEQGLKNIMVSNGFQSPECLDELAGLIDAANIDLKGFTSDFYRQYCGASLDPVRRNLKHIVDMGWWLEVTTLVIPGLNDGPGELEALAGFIAAELGPDVPWHVSRFHPDFEMLDRPATPVEILEQAQSIGRRAGLHYVYVGNVLGHDGENTLCPECGQTLIRREGFGVTVNRLQSGSCPDCRAAIAGRWGA